MAYSCANTTGKTDDKSVIFTRIPATPDHVRVEWLTRLHREDIDPKKFLPGKDHVLCSRHFDERCFEIDMALKLMKGVEKRKFKDTTTIVPTIFSHVRPTAPRPNTEQRMAKKAKDKMMDQLLHGPDDPSQASEEACLVAVENIQSVIDRDIDESAIDAEQSPAEGMDESDESFHLESEDSTSGSDMSTDSQQPAVSDINHPPLESTEERQTKWRKVDSKAHTEIKKIVLNTRFLNDMTKLTLFCHTGDLESYHFLITKYCPKRQHFGMEGMIARTQLAALDYSHNVNRKQAVVMKGKDKGQLRYKSVCTKQNKQWVLKPVMEHKHIHTYLK
ncbi:hypothetical protein ScPMuIL_000179 [Solemya velum]